MKIINYTYPVNKTASLSPYFEIYDPEAKFLFFDIETTGFIAKNTSLYLIGALYYADNEVQIVQWFNEDGKSEAEMLSSFSYFCNDFSHLVHFNGITFDLPYLKQKAEHHKIEFSLDIQMEQIDIYKIIRHYKDIFQLDTMKQVSIEHFLGIHRNDIYSGKELISIYQQYITSKNADFESLLLLHNHDDLLGMPQISIILNYKLFMEQPSIETISFSVEKPYLQITFTYSAQSFLPKRISLQKNGIYLNAFEQKAILQIPIIEDTLYHFFDNYKDYYYLPLEDMAIHKSVAQFVDSTNKKRATKNTCYIKKTDVFVPCYSLNHAESFQFQPNDKMHYQTLDKILAQSEDENTEYIQSILKQLQ